MTDTINPIFQLINENLFALVTLTLSVLIFPLVVSYIEKEHWSPLARKKNVWKQFIGKNNSIKECFELYDSVEKKANGSPLRFLVLNMALIVYLFAQIIIVVLLTILMEAKILPLVQSHKGFITYYGNDYFAFLLVGFLLLVVYLMPNFIFLAWMDSSLKNVNPNNYDLKYSDTKLLYLICILLSYYYTMFPIMFAEQSNYLSIAFIMFPLITVIMSHTNKRKATKNIKNLVNEKFAPLFPYVKITTMGAEHYAGRPKNVFDKESIKLVHNNKEIIILWDAVATISETNENEELQRQLSSFFR